MPSNRLIALFLCCVLAATGTVASMPAAAASAGPTTRVLFVGNSLTYVHNLPAMVSALASVNGKRVDARMLARGGATMQDHVNAGLAEKSMRSGEVDVLVLQEQGGALLCGSGPSCDGPTQALARLTADAQAAHVRPILLGTYQELPVASKAIEAAEVDLARKAGIETRVGVSEALRHARAVAPTRAWLAADGHPGADLTMLMAIRLYHALYGSWPTARQVTVRGTDYSASPHFTGWSIREEPGAGAASAQRFDADRMGALIALGRQ